MPNFYDLFGRDGLRLMQLMGLSGSGVGYGNLTLIIVMVAIVVFRPQKIARIGAFRRAFYLLGASILMSPIVQITFTLLAGGAGARDRDLTLLLISLLNHVPGILTGLSVIYLGRGIIPRFLPPGDGASSAPGTEPPPFQKEPTKPANRPPWEEEESSRNTT